MSEENKKNLDNSPRKTDQRTASPVRQATQADAGWRAAQQNQAPARQATQADAGWRAAQQNQAPARQATQADAGWRAAQQNQAPVRQATQADAGWRAAQQNQAPARQATQADAGWRAAQQNQAPARQAAQADAGWRAAQQQNQAPARQATQADAGWRAAQQNQVPARQATQADAGWRAAQQNQAPVRQATQADAGWRARQQQSGTAGRQTSPAVTRARPAASALTTALLEELMRSANANAFADLADFKDAAGQLRSLTSGTGTVYTVKRVLSTEGGESAVLLCSDPGGEDVVAKITFKAIDRTESSVTARKKVFEYMMSPEGQRYTMAILDAGIVGIGGADYYFEIFPYCPEGDMSHEPPFDFERLVRLIAYLNRAVHSMHEAGILHLDIKPENLYKYNGRVVFGDFGVAKIINTKMGGTAHMTQTTVGTDGYRAPETVMAVTAGAATFILDEKCDYYSLGATIVSLYEGHYLYDGMDAAMITVAYRNGRLPIQRADAGRIELENLVNGLGRIDSKQRFGYDDVNKWLEDHSYTGGISDSEGWPKAFMFMEGEEYRDEKSLFKGITMDPDHWEAGKDMLFDNYFRDFFRSFRQDLARTAQKVDEQWRTKDPDFGLFVFLKALFTPGPIVWKGYTFESLTELAEKMKSTRSPEAYGEILQKKCVSYWLAHTNGISVEEETEELVEQIETYADASPEIACYWFGNSFSKVRGASVGGVTVTTLEQFTDVLFGSPDIFYSPEGLDKLMSRQEGADLFGFLYSYGYKDLIDQYLNSGRKAGEFGKACSIMALLDMIVDKEGLPGSAAKIRRFFTQYGPAGFVPYVRALVLKRGTQVYEPLDRTGEQILSQIARLELLENGTVEELYRSYSRGLELIDQLRKILIDNPYVIAAGAYEKTGVLCRNLAGCFGYNMLGRMAPLGFSAQLETA